MPTGPTIELWRPQAQMLTAFQPSYVPLDVLIEESVEVAKFVREFWQPEDDRPGLELAGDKLPAAIADELLSLREAVQDAQIQYRLAIMPRDSHEKELARAAHDLGQGGSHRNRGAPCRLADAADSSTARIE